MIGVVHCGEQQSFVSRFQRVKLKIMIPQRVKRYISLKVMLRITCMDVCCGPPFPAN